MTLTEPASHPAFKVTVLTKKSELPEISRQWDDLMLRSDHATPYLSRFWVETWMHHNPRAIFQIICVWHGKLLTAILALNLRSFGLTRVAECIGEKHHSYLGVLVDHKQIWSVDVIVNWLNSQRLICALIWRNISTLDAQSEALLDRLAERGWVAISDSRRFTCWRTELAPTLESFLSRHISGKSRRKLRWKENTLYREYQVEIHTYRGREISESLIERLADISRNSEKHDRGVASLEDSFNRMLLQRAAESGFARVWLMLLNGRDSAFIAGFEIGSTFFYKWPAHRRNLDDRLSVGKLLLIQSIGDCCEQENGLKMFDFGHGTFDYKKSLSTEQFATRRAAIGRGIFGRLAVLGMTVKWRKSRFDS